MIEKLYPLKFTPIIKELIWGGKKLKELFNKEFRSIHNGGESWEISSVKNNVSVVENGTLRGLLLTDLIDKYKEELIGVKCYERFGNQFPLLIKLIDANDDLSVQVHPNDKLASERHQSYGKTEMWYVIDADENSKLISGFNKKISSEDYIMMATQGNFIDLLASHSVCQGDILFIPAGRVHAIGKGTLIAEIQQCSDVTYRIFDYNRVDSEGKSRQLHISEAQLAIDFNDTSSGKIKYILQENIATKVVESPYFTTSIINVNDGLIRDYSKIDSFVLLMSVEGSAVVVCDNRTYTLNWGETILIPASVPKIIISSINCKILEIHL